MKPSPADLPFQVKTYIDRLKEAAKGARFKLEPFGIVEETPLLALTRKALHPDRTPMDPPVARIFISAGIHGDEPAGSLAILRLLKSRWFSFDVEWTLIPALNPAGLARKTRENPQGADLNRDFRDFAEKETRAYRDWIDQREPPLQADLALFLHEDWEAKGFYCYELTATHQEDTDLKYAIQGAAVKSMPLDPRDLIDERVAKDGWINPILYEGLDPASADEVPGAEAIWFHLRAFSERNYTFETPSSAYIEDRVRVHSEAIQAATRVILNRHTAES